MLYYIALCVLSVFEVIVYALDSGNFFVNPDTLAMAIRNTSTVALLTQAGFAFVVSHCTVQAQQL